MPTKSSIPKMCVQRLHKDHVNEFKKIHSSKNSDDAAKLSAAFWTKKIWKQGTILTYSFLSKKEPNIDRTQLDGFQGKTKVDPLQLELQNVPIKKAIKIIVEKRIKPLVSGSLDIRYVEDPSKAIIRISFDRSGGAWSLVGTDCLLEKKDATMNLGWFDVPTTIHEFGHAIGLIHEHQNPGNSEVTIHKDKLPDGTTCNLSSQGIDWNVPAVLNWAETTQGWDEKTTCTNILQKYSNDQINGSAFDPCSIMLYFFPDSLVKTGKGTNQNNRLSGNDVRYITEQYKTKGEDHLFSQFYGEDLEDNIKSCSEQSRRNTLLHSFIIFIITCLIIGIVVYIVMRIIRKTNIIKNTESNSSSIA